MKASLFSFTSLTERGKLAVKICGLMRPEDALVAARSGADMVGMVFAPSKRKLLPEQARLITSALDAESRTPLKVGVFVNETPEHIQEIARFVGLDIVQLSGDETPEQVAECARFSPVIKALRFPAGTSAAQAIETVHDYLSLGLGERLMLLIDAYHPGEYGGTGSAADWALSAVLARETPVMLAGGLNPGNLESAVGAVAPWGLDVSSGVERDGVKDPSLIIEFISTARAFQSSVSGAQSEGYYHGSY